ncbi:MAG: hypothetical protein LQ346_007971 [Caloplaca aetnensis]|nr:MAG: hypothetical protein LQ346_007971 [Caloplaca aetnensis]
MHFSKLFTLLSYLIFLAAPVFATPLAVSSLLASSPTVQTPHPQHRARVLVPPGRVVTVNSLTHNIKVAQLFAFYPLTSALVRTFNSLYLGIMVNLSPQGPWFNIPPMSRVILQARDVYLEFVSEDPSVPVPWYLVRGWAQAMDDAMARGGFVGFYVASFERLAPDNLLKFWIHMGVGEPPGLAAAGAKRRRI